MRNSTRPSGPGKPTHERRDSTTEREELEEMTDEAQGRADDGQRDPMPSARQAERDANVRGESTDTQEGTSHNRRG